MMYQAYCRFLIVIRQLNFLVTKVNNLKGNSQVMFRASRYDIIKKHEHLGKIIR